jgi:hypothetical protein
MSNIDHTQALLRAHFQAYEAEAPSPSPSGSSPP